MPPNNKEKATTGSRSTIRFKCPLPPIKNSATAVEPTEVNIKNLPKCIPDMMGGGNVDTPSYLGGLKKKKRETKKNISEPNGRWARTMVGERFVKGMGEETRRRIRLVHFEQGNSARRFCCCNHIVPPFVTASVVQLVLYLWHFNRPPRGRTAAYFFALEFPIC